MLNFMLKKKKWISGFTIAMFAILIWLGIFLVSRILATWWLLTWWEVVLWIVFVILLGVLLVNLLDGVWSILLWIVIWLVWVYLLLSLYKVITWKTLLSWIQSTWSSITSGIKDVWKTTPTKNTTTTTSVNWNTKTIETTETVWNIDSNVEVKLDVDSIIKTNSSNTNLKVKQNTKNEVIYGWRDISNQNIYNEVEVNWKNLIINGEATTIEVVEKKKTNDWTIVSNVVVWNWYSISNIEYEICPDNTNECDVSFDCVESYQKKLFKWKDWREFIILKTNKGFTYKRHPWTIYWKFFKEEQQVINHLAFFTDPYNKWYFSK